MNRSISSASIQACSQQPNPADHASSTNNLPVGRTEVIPPASTESVNAGHSPEATLQPSSELLNWIMEEFQKEFTGRVSSLKQVATRMALEVERICRLSQRIQASGEVKHWQRSLARHRITKCLKYFELAPTKAGLSYTVPSARSPIATSPPARLNSALKGATPC
jgi:hypothetical protein